MLDKLYNRITGDKLFDTSIDPKEPIIEGMLFRQDYVTLIAEEKVGKTILAQQMAASLSSGTSFLGTYDIPKPMKVFYFATEGRSNDLKDRFIRINKKVKIDTNNLTLIPSFFKFNTVEGLKCLEEIISETEEENYPDVIFIDSLYSGFSGSLKEDEDVNLFNNTVRQLIEKLKCAVIVVHHMKKNSKDDKGNYHKRSDKDSYGSAFLSAAVDHVFWLEKWRDKEFPKDRAFRCDTQRGGDIIDTTRLRLSEPDPLYFYQVSNNYKHKNQITKILTCSADGYSIDKLLSLAKDIKRSNMYTILKELQEEGVIEKYKPHGQRTVFYHLLGSA